jgi:two-component system response regulator QseB
MSSDISTENEIEAYNLGASNFMAKPIDFNILKAILRKNLRAIDDSLPDRITTPHFFIDLKLYKVFEIKDGQETEIPLTKIEFNILLSLAKNINTVKTKEDLSYLGKDHNEPMSFKALEMHIASLRKKISHDVIQTKRGVGYFLSSQRENS